jgi:hypothetical protein
MKERALYNVLRGNYTDDMKVVISKTEDGETIATGLRYLEHYWPELATNQLLISNFNDEHLMYMLPKILIQCGTDEKDILDFVSMLSMNKLYTFIAESFPHKICTKLYQMIENKTILINRIEDFSSSDFSMNLVSVIVMVGDRDTFIDLLDEIGISRVKQSYVIQSYFRGAAVNKDALSWLSDGIFDSPTYLIMNFVHHQ